MKICHFRQRARRNNAETLYVQQDQLKKQRQEAPRLYFG